MQAHGFRVYFTPLSRVLFTFPSRYWYTIGHVVVFSLARWCWLIPAGFLRSRGTQGTSLANHGSRTGLSPSSAPLSNGPPVPLLDRLCLPYNPRDAETPLVWADPRSLAATWGIPNWSLFLPLLRCFSSRGSPLLAEFFRVSPFGDPWITGRLRLPTDFRSLPRPSSPLRA